jgi:hypothetical protein
MELPKRFHPYAILAVALALFVAPLLFGRTLTNFADMFAFVPGSEHRPPGWFHSNAIDGSPIFFFNPSDLLNRELLRAGELFSWNPYVGFGTPWLGVMQAAPYFPGKLISMLWPNYWRGQDLMLVGLLLTAGIGNYLLLRSMGVDREGAIFSGLAYMLCQRLFMIINMPSFMIESLLPLMLYAVHELVKRKTLHFALLAGAIGGSQFLGGFPEASFIFGLITALFFLWVMVGDARAGGDWRRAIVLAALTAALTLMLSAFQLIEFVRLLTESYTFHDTHYGTVVKQPYWLLAMFLPNAFGTPFVSYWIAQIGHTDHMPPSMFCGISTLIFGIAALLWRRAPGRSHIWFFALVFFVFTGYCYGFPILRYIGHLPLINRTSTAWIVWVIPFSLTVLAGFGVQSLRAQGAAGRSIAAFAIYGAALVALLWALPTVGLPPWRSFRALVYVVPALIVALMLYRQRRWLPVGAGMLFVLITLEAYFCAKEMKYLHYYGPALAELPSLTWIKRNLGHDRIFGVEGIYPANTLNPARVRDIRHLDAMSPELYVEYADAIWSNVRRNVFQISNSEWKIASDPLLDLAAVKYVLTHTPLQPVPAGLTQVYSDRDATVYRSDRAFARARFVPDAIAPPDNFAPSMLKGMIERLQTAVVLDGYSGEARKGGCDAPGAAAVEFLQDGVNQIRLKVSAPCSGFLVLADLFYPGWQATLDGKSAPVYKANYAFRAVEVDAGTHEVVFAYRPWSTRIGVPVAALTALGLLAFFAFATIRNARPRGQRVATSA